MRKNRGDGAKDGDEHRGQAQWKSGYVAGTQNREETMADWGNESCFDGANERNVRNETL